MKLITNSVLVLFMALLCWSCTDEKEEPVIETERIQFDLGVLDGDESNGRSAAVNAIPDGAKLMLSLNDKDGNPVLTNHLINILKAGTNYITEPIELKAGPYTVTDFMVVKDDEVVFATPKKGSAFAPLVKTPLPFNFTIGKSTLRNVAVEVVNVAYATPEQLGYASFNIKEVNPLELVVFALKNNQWGMVSGKAYIMDGDAILQTFNLGARINLLGFKQDPDKDYTLKIVVDGYEPYIRGFNYKRLKHILGSLPLKIYLGASIDFTFFAVNDDYDEVRGTLRLQIEGTGSVTLVWGDGVTQSVSLPLDAEYEYDPGTYVASIKGNLSNITRLYAGSNYYLHIDEIAGIEHLPNLQHLRLGFGTDVTNPLNLSNATQLQSLDLGYVDVSGGITLPDSPYLYSVLIWAKNLFTQSEADAVINRVYNNAVAHDLYGGELVLQEIESLSPTSATRLATLRDLFFWNITINGSSF